jgi:hypothetical protein
MGNATCPLFNCEFQQGSELGGDETRSSSASSVSRCTSPTLTASYLRHMTNQSSSMCIPASAGPVAVASWAGFGLIGVPSLAYRGVSAAPVGCIDQSQFIIYGIPPWNASVGPSTTPSTIPAGRRYVPGGSVRRAGSPGPGMAGRPASFRRSGPSTP